MIPSVTGAARLVGAASTSQTRRTVVDRGARRAYSILCNDAISLTCGRFILVVRAGVTSAAFAVLCYHVSSLARNRLVLIGRARGARRAPG